MTLLRGLSSWHLLCAVLTHWLAGLGLAWLIAAPWLDTIHRHVARYPEPGEALLAGDGVRLAEALGSVHEASASDGWRTLGVLSLGLLLLLLPAAWLTLANARKHCSSFANHVQARGLVRVVRSTLADFATLMLLSAGLLCLLAFGAVLGVLVCELMLTSPTNEALADSLTFGIAGVFALAALMLQPLSDLARMQIVCARHKPLRAFTQAFIRLRRSPLQLYRWASTMGGAWVVALGVAYGALRADPEAATWSWRVLEQSSLLLLSCARSRWLSYAAESCAESPRAEA